MAGGFARSRRIRVAFQTSFVVSRGICLQLFVWVMAGSTRKPCIPFSPAFTGDQTVRRRSRGRDAFDSSEFYIPPGTVTGAAEVDRIRGVKMSGVEDRWLRLSGRGRGLASHGVDMASARSVTGFTRYAGNQVSLVETSADA